MALELNGKVLASRTEEELKVRVDNVEKELGYKPILATILVGDNPASVTYVNMKIKALIACPGQAGYIKGVFGLIGKKSAFVSVRLAVCNRAIVKGFEIGGILGNELVEFFSFLIEVGIRWGNVVPLYKLALLRQMIFELVSCIHKACIYPYHSRIESESVILYGLDKARYVNVHGHIHNDFQVIGVKLE